MTRGKAFRAVLLALAAAIAPVAHETPSAFAAAHVTLVDGPRAGQKWDPSLTPYTQDILDLLGPDSPHNRIDVMKSAQVGVSQIVINWGLYVAARDPARMMIVQPTIQAAQDFNREKFGPTIEDSPEARKRVRRQTSRSSEGSTQLNKRFPGGSIIITGANSTADLRSKTVKYVACDEVDEYPLDLDGQGDPLAMVDARQISFHATGDWKQLRVSTPTVKGASRIEAGFEAGDQRFLQVPCPHCDEYQRLVFKHLKFNDAWPHEAHYVCQHCGVAIEEHHKAAMIARWRFVATRPEPGRHPSFHISALYSQVTTWDAMAAAFIAAKDDPSKLKTFVNLWLGETWEERGDAPEWQRLHARRLDYAARTVPEGGLVITAGADVQLRGIYYEVQAWARDRRSWSIDVGFIKGRPDDPDDAAWRALDEVYARVYPTAHGLDLRIDAMAVDSQYCTNQVHLWTRARPNAHSVQGKDGWARAAIASAPTPVDISWRNKRIRRGALLWTVGTWPIKAQMYAELRKDGIAEGAEQDPPGYCYFSTNVNDDAYFKQLTAESLQERPYRGRTMRMWVASGDNHWHDCRVYGTAMAHRLGVFTLTEREWDAIAAQRGRPAPPRQGDLLDRAPKATDPRPTASAAPPPASPPRAGGVVVRGAGRVIVRG